MSDVATFFADGVGTARRAHIGIVPNELFRRSWIDSNSVAPLLTISSEFFSSGGNLFSWEVKLQFTVVLRSTKATTAPAVSGVVTHVTRAGSFGEASPAGGTSVTPSISNADALV